MLIFLAYLLPHYVADLNVTKCYLCLKHILLDQVFNVDKISLF